MIDSLPIALSRMDRGSGMETWSGVEQSRRGDVAPNLLTLAGILALQSWEEVGVEQLVLVSDLVEKIEL